MGDKGIAQAYLIYPGKAALIPGESFTVHVRHVLMPIKEREIPAVAGKLWKDFEAGHAVAKTWSRYPAKSPSELMKRTR
jgi:hypothetical protein